MLERIVEFSELLRRNGIRVSLPENMDAARALEFVGVGDQRSFKSALRTSLIKRSIDTKTFDELFDLYFLGLGETSRKLEQNLMQQLGLSPEEFQRMLDHIQSFLDSLDGQISRLTRALLAGDMGEVERLLREAAEEEANESRGELRAFILSQGIAERLGLEGIRDEIENFKLMLLRMGADPQTVEKMSAYAEQRFRDLLQMARQLAQRETQKKSRRARCASGWTSCRRKVSPTIPRTTFAR